MKKVVFVLIVFVSNNIFSQGCSDAGFCTSENMKYGTSVDSLKHTIKFGINQGSADFDVSVFGMYLEYKYQINEKINLGTRINYTSQSKDAVSSSAISDGYIIADYLFTPTLSASVGLKIPFSDGNVKENGFALPMDLQPSLGTYDLVLGVSKKYNNLFFALGYQQPLNKNKNTFFKPLSTNEFFTTNQFKRAPDLLLRVGYSYEINNKWKLSPSLLPIYHLANDTFEDVTNQEIEIKGSEGLTLNASLLVQYLINNKNALEFNLGSPLITRDARPDGLTRSFVLNLEYKFSF
ncbi:hypothetical protein [Flavobacterium cheniae]|uniref:Uncharacterized protein n=1 Tax=Flavobacterium cheniae TaxID=295428 RepID=A0A562KDS8_9FLAO|nr:hypothetical protein [Flavobacterium cheniae]TDR19672.1 hypothetical protein C8D80_2353 [Flavobacterium cheniae]TWH93522.1 hypothetical protein IP97_02038 [Flavobacterium cheniae]